MDLPTTTETESLPSIQLLGIQSPRPRRKSSNGLQHFSPMLDVLLFGPENGPIKELAGPESISTLNERSPIVLYGPTGVGKTALAITLATRWINESSTRNYHFIHANDFARSLVHAIDADDMPRFREQFRTCHCLLIDNVHELTGKDAAQSELIEMLNAMEQRESLVIFTSQVLPPLISNWNDALASRMVSGHSIEFQLPSPSTRLEILKRLNQNRGIGIPDPMLSHLNQQLNEGLSVFQLLGVVSRWQHLQKASELAGQTTDQETLEKVAAHSESKSLTPLEIAKLVAKELRQTLESLRGPSRKASVVRARGLAMYLIRLHSEISFQSVGELFGNRDHTTVMHACRKTEEDLSNDSELARCADKLRQRLSR